MYILSTIFVGFMLKVWIKIHFKGGIKMNFLKVLRIVLRVLTLGTSYLVDHGQLEKGGKK